MVVVVEVVVVVVDVARAQQFKPRPPLRRRSSVAFRQILRQLVGFVFSSFFARPIRIECVCVCVCLSVCVCVDAVRHEARFKLSSEISRDEIPVARRRQRRRRMLRRRRLGIDGGGRVPGGPSHTRAHTHTRPHRSRFFSLSLV